MALKTSNLIVQHIIQKSLYLYNNELHVCLAYDRYIKLWDTETGECVSRFTSRKIPYCAKFHPDEDKQHLFVAGTSDKKIICVSQQNIYVIPCSVELNFCCIFAQHGFS
jgi:WD40 repeat protein